jgi:hypothetical protein
MNALRTLIAATAACAPLLASAAPEIVAGSTVLIEKNKAKNIVAVGGSIETGKLLGGVAKGAAGNMTGVANVNSLVLNSEDAKVRGNVTITGNEADGVFAIGGTTNVNSVVLGK